MLGDKKVTRRDFVKGVAVGGSILVGSSLLGCAEKKPEPTPTPKPAETPKPTPTPPKEPIKIGVLGPLSGPFTPWGDPHLKGAQMAVEEINANGGVLGRPIELVVRDTKNNPSESTTSFEELVYQEKVVAVIGPVSSDVGMATSRKADELKVPLFLHMAGSEKILTKDSRYTFRTALSPAPVLMQALAEYIKTKGYTRIGAVVADYGWGHAVKRGIEKYIATLPDVNVQIEVAPVKEADFTPYLRKMSDLDPELIIATSHPPGTAKIAKQGLELGLKANYIGPNFPKKIWESALGDKVTQGMLDFSAVDYESQEFIKLAEKYYEKYGEELDFAGTTGYVNIYHLAWAMEQAGSANPQDIANKIRNGTYKTPLFAYPLSYVEWGDLKEAREVIVTFKPGPPPYNPKAISHFEVEYITPPLTPPEPES